MSSPVVQARTGSGFTFETGSHHGVIGTEWSQDRWQNRAPDHVYSIVAIPSMRPGGYTTHTTADGEVVRISRDVGENPPAGVIVTYRLVDTPDVPLDLVFRDAGGEEVRTFSSRKADDPPQAKERRAPAQAGWNRFVWDMRHTPATKIEGDDPAEKEPIPGPIVMPGEYTVTLMVGGARLTQPFRIVTPGNILATEDDLKSQHDLLLRIHCQIDRTTMTINRMRDLRAQLDSWARRTRD